MQIEFQNSPKIYKRYLKRHFLSSFYERLPIYGFISILFAYSNETEKLEFLPFLAKTFLFFIIIIFLLYVFPYFFTLFNFKKRLKNRYFFSEKIIIEIQDDGFQLIIKHNKNKFLWQSIADIEVYPAHLVIKFVDGEIFIIPDSAFYSNTDKLNFVGLLKQKLKDSPILYQQTSSGKPPYELTLISFVPLIGIIVGLILISHGIRKYKNKWFTLLAISGLIFNIYFFTGLLPKLRKLSFIEVDFKKNSLKNMTELIKQIEFYKLENGDYPKNLDVLRKTYKNVSIFDPLQMENNNKKKSFYYKKTGKQYELFSKGKDGQAYTFDDILPEISKKSIGKIGLKTFRLKKKP